MPHPKIAQLFTEIERLPEDQQAHLADEIAADLADMKFAYNIANDIPMPTFEALVAQARQEIAEGHYVNLDEFLEEEE